MSDGLLKIIIWVLIGIIGVLVLIILYFYTSERRALEQEMEAEREAEGKRDEIESDVKNRPDDQLDGDLNKWFRD